ncbi:hypothetical protein ANTPLA_LOCUS6842 [Anthophora plagiata]
MPSAERHLSGTHSRISCRVQLIATPKRDTKFVARVTDTSRSRKGLTTRFRDRQNRISRDTISDITQVTPCWCRNGVLEKHGIPQVPLEEIERKKESVRNRFTKLLLDSIRIDLTLAALAAIRTNASEPFIRSHPTVTLKINCPPSERYLRNFTTFTGLKKLSR